MSTVTEKGKRKNKWIKLRGLLSFRWVTNDPTYVSCPAREYYFHFALTFSNCCCCHCFHSAQGFELYNSWWARCSNGWQFVIVIGGGGGVIRYNNQNDKSFFSLSLSSLPSPFRYPLLFSSLLSSYRLCFILSSSFCATALNIASLRVFFLSV